MIDAIMRNALKANWNLTDDFDFRYSNPSYPFPGIDGFTPQESLDICTMNIDLPQLSAGVDAILQGGEYRLVSKKFESFVITVNFRDTLGLKLRDYFINIWQAQQTKYPDDIKSKLEVEVHDNIIFNSMDCLIVSVSQAQFDNSNTQITEFTVEFNTPFYTNTNGLFGDYGKTGYSVEYDIV